VTSQAGTPLLKTDVQRLYIHEQIETFADLSIIGIYYIYIYIYILKLL